MKAIVNKVVRFNRETFQNESVYSVAIYTGEPQPALGQPLGTPCAKYRNLVRVVDCPKGKGQAEYIAQTINGAASC